MFKFSFQLITHSDLGKINSSLTTVGALLTSRAVGQAQLRVFANAANGNLHIEDHHKTIIDNGFKLSVGLVYNSQAKTPDQAWRFSLGKSLTVVGQTNEISSSILLHEPDGATTSFQYDAVAPCYVAKGLAGGNQYVTKNTDGTWVWQQPGSGLQAHYDAQGRQRDCVDAAGRTLNYQYDAQGQLTKIIAPSGQQIQLDGSTEKQLTVKLLTAEQTTLILAHYTFDEVGRLLTSDIPLDETHTYTTTYAYTDNQNAYLFSIQQSDQTTLQFAYQPVGNRAQLKQITEGEQCSHSLNYETGKTQLHDALNNQTQIAYDTATGRLTAITRPAMPWDASTTVQYAYDENGALQQITYPSGTTESYTYDDLGLCHQFTDGLGRIQTYHQNAQGLRDSQTQFLDDGTALTTRFIYDAKRQLRYEITPKGAVTCHDYDDAGHRITTQQHRTACFDTNQSPPDTELTLATLDMWWQQQDLSQVSLSTYQYTTYGQINHEMRYATVNAQGQGIFDAHTGETTTTWGVFNQWLTRSERQSDTVITPQQQQYDGLNRLTQVTDALGNKTTQEYQDSQQKIIVTLPNGLAQTKRWDTAGRTQEYQESFENQQRITRYQRDAAGRPLAIQQPDGRYRYTYYDGQGHVAYTINPHGYVQEYRYDEHGHTQQIIRYATAITLDPTKLPDLQGLIDEIFVNPPDDRCVITYYNAAGQLQYEVDGEHNLTQYDYDSAGRLKNTVRYDTSLTDPQVEKVLAGKNPQLISHPNDRIQYYYYDADNRMTGTLLVAASDHKGYLTEYQRNSIGQRQRKLCYATFAIANTALDTTRPKTSPEDAVDYYFRDARGQRVAEINAEHYLTTHEYNANGLETRSAHYAKSIDPTTIHSLSDIKPISDPENQTTDLKYDACNRIVQTTEQPLAKETILTYDAMGNKTQISVIDLYDSRQRRDCYYRYNAWSQKTAVLDARAVVLLAQIQADKTLTSDQKTVHIEQLWQQSATRHLYETSGLRLATINPVGSQTLFYYNDMRQLCATLNPVGALQTQNYNAFDDKPILTRRFVKTLTSDQLAHLSGGFLTPDILPLFNALENTSTDSINIYQRDRRGLTIVQTDPENYQTIRQYNAFSERIESKQQINNSQWITTRYEHEARGLETTVTTDAQGLKLTVQRSYNVHSQVSVLIDPLNHTQLFGHDRLGRQTQHTDALQQTSQQSWDAFTRLSTITDCLGQITQHTYHTPQRQHTVTSPTGITVITQSNVFSQTVTITDANGGVQEFFYEPGGELTTQTNPNGCRLYTKELDLAGRLIQHTAQNGLITVYQLDAAGQIATQIEDPKPNGLAYTTHFNYDGLGEEISRQDARGVFTRTEHDRCGHTTATIIDPPTPDHPKGLGLTTRYTQDGLGHKTTQIQGSINDSVGLSQQNVKIEQKSRWGAGLKTVEYRDVFSDRRMQFRLKNSSPPAFENVNGTALNDSATRVTQWLRDTASRLMTEILDPGQNGLNLTQRFTLDAAGNRLTTQDPNSNVTRTVWDQLNRKRFAIDPTGTVSEWQYDANNHVVLTRIYAIGIDVNAANEHTTPDQVAALVKTSDRDRVHRYYYDADGQQIYDVDTLGRVIEQHYDAINRPIGKTHYANPMATQSLASATLADVKKMRSPSAQDRSHWKIYDLADLRFTLQMDGSTAYVQSQVVDSQGNIVVKTTHAMPIDLKGITTYTFETIAPLIQLHPDDRITHQVFDSLNNLVFSATRADTKDDRWIIIQYTYDEANNLTQTRRYYQPVSTPATWTVAAINAVIREDEFDRVTKNAYDAAKRCYQTADGLGYTESWTYNSFNECSVYQDKAGYLWQTTFDNAGRKIQKQTPSTTLTTVQPDPKNPNQLISVSSQATIITEQQHDKNGNVLCVTEAKGDPQARSLAFHYDANNNMHGTTLDKVTIDDPTQTPNNPQIRPEKTVTLTTRTTFNAFRQPIAYQDEAGNGSFKVYDPEGQLRYEVDAKQQVTGYERNAFGQVTTLTRYANPIAINPNDYAETGLTLADMAAKLKPNPAEDRSLTTQYNTRGLKIQVQQNAVWVYIPSNDQNPGQLSKAQPTQQWAYNAFNDIVVERQLIEPVKGRWAVNRTWYNGQGKPLAEATALGYITAYQRDCDGQVLEKIEYLTPLLPNQLDITDDQLQEQITTLTPGRQYRSTYDCLSQLASETRVGIVIQQISLDSTGKPQLSDRAPQDLTKTYQRDPLGRIVTTTYEDGAKAAIAYNELGQIRATLSVPRANQDDATLTQEIQRRGYNALGNEVSRLRTSQVLTSVHQQALESITQQLHTQTAAGKATLSSSQESALEEDDFEIVTVADDKPIIALDEPTFTNAFIAADNLPTAQLTLRLWDVRGLNIVTQDPAGALTYYSFTATKKTGRQWQWVTGWQDFKNPTQHFYQSRWEYDPIDQTLADHRREYDTGQDTSTFYQHNPFGEVIAEGPDGQHWPVINRYDQVGQCWATNQGNGVYTLQLYDARRQQTAAWRSQNNDLSAKGYEDLPQLNTWDYTQLMRTEMVRDDQGRILSQKQPVFKHLKPGSPQPLNTLLTVGKQYPTLDTYSLSWPQPADLNFVATLKLWVKDSDPSTAKTVPVIINNGRMGADISAFIADVYEYQITYFFHDPATNQTDNIPLFQGIGEIPLDTGKTADSQHIVITQISDSEIVLTGKTAAANGNSLAGVEVIQNGKVIARVAATTTDVAGRYRVDLSDQVSGTYTFRPIYGFNNVGTPMGINQTSDTGFRLEAHSTQLTMSEVGKIEYGLFYANGITWSDLPPGCNLLRGHYAYTFSLDMLHPSLGGQHITLSEDFPASAGSHRYAATAPAIPLNLNANGAAPNYFSTANTLYALDDQQQPWPIGNGYNAHYPNETHIPPFLYLIPTTTQRVAQEAVAVLQNGNVVQCLATNAWMNGMRRVDLSSVPNPQNYQYQVVQLNSQPATAPESQPMTLFTAHPAAHLIAREIAQDDLQMSYLQPPIGMKSIRYFIHWTLANDLNDKPLWLNLSVLSNPIQIGFGRATNGLVSAGLGNLEAKGIILTNPKPTAHAALSVQIGEDWVPLFDAAPYQIDGQGWSSLSHFRFRTLYFSPLPEAVKTVQLEYLDTTLATPTWRSLPATFTGHGMAVNVAALPFNGYPFRLKAFDQNNKAVDLSSVAEIDANGYAVGQFTVGGYNNQFYTTNSPEIDEVVYPVQQQVLDPWGNILESTDPLGNTTAFSYTDQNKIGVKTQPQITVTDEDGSTRLTHPTTQHGYDARGRTLAVRDPNGHVTAHWRNAAGETIKTVLGDGVYQVFNRDAFGRVISIRDPQNYTIQHSYDLRDCLITSTDACGWQTRYTSNELKQRLSTTNGEGQITRFDYNSQGQVATTYQPEGQASTTTYDRNGQSLVQNDGTAKPLTWTRDYFSNVQSHTDKSGAVITYQRNFLQQVTQQIGQGGDHGQQYDLSGQKVPVPPQSLHYLFNEAGYVAYQLDDAVPLTTRYYLDLSGRRIGERFIARDGQVYQDTYLEFNACGWIIRNRDTRIEGLYGFDAKGNRRSTIVYYDPDNNPILCQQNWYTYNEADRIIITQGDLVNGCIQISSNKGTQLTYNASGWRFQETRFNGNGHKQINTLYYLNNGLLDHTQTGPNNSKLPPFKHNTGARYSYDKAQRRLDYGRINEKGIPDTTTTTYNANSWITQQVEQTVFNSPSPPPNPRNNQQIITQTTQFSGFDNAGHNTTQVTTVQIPEPSQIPTQIITDHLTTTWVGFDDLKIVQTTGQRQDNNGFGAYGTLYATYDANGNFASLQGNLEDKTTFRNFITNAEGRIVLKTNGAGKREYYFYDALGNPVGRFGDLPDDKLTQSIPSDVNFDLNFNPVSEHFPPPAPEQYTASDGQTFEQIAEIVYGDSTLANVVAEANGYSAQDTVPSGMTLRIPSLVNTNIHNWAGEYPVYNPSAIVGGLYPNMPVPPPPPTPTLPPPPHHHHHHNFFDEVLEVVVGVAVMALLPEVAPLLATALSAALPELFTTTVTGGLVSAGALATVVSNVIVGGALGVLSSIGQQETARALDDQGQFSWKAAWQNSALQAASAGLASATEIVNPLLKGLNGKFILNPIEGAGFNIALQVVQLATGQQHKLSWQQIVIAAGQAIADAGIADVTHEAINNPHLIPRHLAEAAQQIGSNFTNSALSSLETRHFDAETAAADALGAYIGNEAGSAIGKRMTKGAQNSLNNYLAQRQEDQHYNAWLNDLPNRIADRYSQPRSYAAQVIGYTAEDLSHWDDPTVPNGNDDNNNDNPSSNQRQTQTELAKTRAQRFTQDQQQQQTAAAQSSANNPSRFFSRVGSSIMQGVVDIDNLALGTDQALLSDAKGLFYGAKDLLTGKSHPIQAAENLIAGISAVIDDPGIIKEVFDEKLDAFESADRTQKAYMLGRIPADLLEGFATGGAAAAAGTALRTTSLIDTVGFWGKASTIAGDIPIRTFNPKDPGVKEIIEAIESRFPGSVKQAEITIFGPEGKPLTDFDVVTDTHVIQIKIGTGQGISSQLIVSRSLTNLEVIGFDANQLIGRGQMFKPSVINYANQQGFTIYNNVEDLLNTLGEAKYERSYFNNTP